MKTKFYKHNLEVVLFLVILFPLMLKTWNADGQPKHRDSLYQDIQYENVQFQNAQHQNVLLHDALIQNANLQNVQELFHPNTTNNQALHFNVIQGNSISRREVTSLNSFRLRNGENLAIIERGGNLNLLSDSSIISGTTHIMVKKYLLPEIYITRLEDGNTALLEVILINESKLIINRDDKRYHGFITFQMVNSQNVSDAGKDLKEPISIQLLSGSLDTIMPENIWLNRTNSVLTINCSGRKQLADSADIEIVTPIKRGGYEYFLEIEPFLEMNTTKHKIKGMGLQDALITVIYLGSNAKDSIKISVDATLGTVKPNTQFVKFNEPAEFKVRSESKGLAKIKATSRFELLKVSIYYTFPWLYLILPLIGGAFGAFVRMGYDKIRDKEKKITPLTLLVGSFYGLICVIAYFVLRLNLLGIEFEAELNELAVSGISAIAAIIGADGMSNWLSKLKSNNPITSTPNPTAPVNQPPTQNP